MNWWALFVLLTVAAVLLGNRLGMVVSYLVQQAQGERRELLVLRWKLRMLKALAGEIGRTEARLAEIKRSDDG